jgi:hypothetical protein
MGKIRPTASERAVQLALSGRYAGIVDLKRRLLAEGYSGCRNGRQIFHWHFRNELRRMILQARNADAYGS